jgi:hypothetical protein
MTGQEVCDRHGGKAPKALARAERDRVEAQALAALAELDIAPVENPLAELAKLAGQVIAWKDATANLVNELRTLRYRDDKGAEQIRSEILLFERAMDRCNTVLSAMARLKIDERLVAIERDKVDLVARAFEETLRVDLGLSSEQLGQARSGFVRRLRLVDSHSGDQAAEADPLPAQ